MPDQLGLVSVRCDPKLIQSWHYSTAGITRPAAQEDVGLGPRGSAWGVRWLGRRAAGRADCQ
jgi:hypothetical protein